MRQRLGALLCLALGGVLIWSGLSTGGAGTVGAPPPACGIGIGVAAPCPTGTIHFTETTTVHHATMSPADAAPPAGGWQVHITSTCYDTSNGSQPVNETVTVPNNGSIDSQPLYVYSDITSSTHCNYDLSETNPGDFTATFDPASPVQLPTATQNFSLDEALANDITVRTTSPAPPPSSSTPAPPSSSAPSSSVSATASGAPSSVGPSYLPSSSGGGLANTGPSRSINGSLIGGIALCVLGFVLLFAGRVHKPRRHRA